MKLQSRIQTEDFFHDIIADILPQIDKSNIRPAYQKTKMPLPAGGNFVSQDGKNDGIMPFENTSDFIYFYIKPDESSESESEVTADNYTTYIRSINLIVYCYGENSSSNALKLKALMRSQDIQHTLNYNGYYQLEEGGLQSMFEDINGEWWERVDVEFNFTCKVDLEHEPEDTPTIARRYNNNTLVDGGER